MAKPDALPKSERLYRQKAIDALFGAGSHGLSAFPLRAVFRVCPPDACGIPATRQVLFSVAKRKLRHAVDRNRAKRQLREAWRLNRSLLQAEATQHAHIAFIWLADTPQDTPTIVRKMRNLLHRIEEQCAPARKVQQPSV